jgi:FKBP-type peptidyl-prolyl cis-trans isomerase 2
LKDKVLTVCLVGVLAAICFAGPLEGAEKKTGEEVSAVVSDGKTVSVHYTLTVDGSVVDSSREGDPLEFQVGGGQVIPGFEKGVIGMKEGEKKSFQVNPEDGYGQEDPRGLQEIPRGQLPPDVTPEAGMTLHATGPDGQSVPLRVTEVKEDVIVVNLNHPMAGKNLDFDVEVVEIN